MKENIEIIAVGDITYSRDIEKYIEKNNLNYLYPLSNVKKYFINSDITLANLETPITKYPLLYKSNKFSFKSKLDSIKGISDSGINVINIANNHTIDCGDNGLNDTIENLTKNKISIIGHKNSSYIIKTINNKKIGIIGMCTNLNKITEYKLKKGNINKAWQKLNIIYNNKLDNNIISLIKNIKKKVDILIVSIHWGVEYKQKNNKQKQLGLELINLGVNLILGHHPHVIQEMEYIKTNNNSGYIFYSLGNFLFDSHVKNKGVRNTFILKINIDKNNKMQFSYLPCIIYPNIGYIPIPEYKEFQSTYPKISTEKADKLYKYTKCSRTVSCNNIEHFTSLNNFKKENRNNVNIFFLIFFFILLIILIYIKIQF